VSIPSLREKDGYPSVVDHNTPISTAWKGNKAAFNTEKQALEALSLYDREGNFSITERGLNTAKSDKTDWDEITREWKSRVKDQEKYEEEAKSVTDLTVPDSTVKFSEARKARGYFDGYREVLSKALPEEVVSRLLG
jgi:hypothetical protein